MMRTMIFVSMLALGCSGGTPNVDGGSTMTMTDAAGASDTATGTAGDYSCIFVNSANCMDYVGTAFRNPNRKAVEQMGCTAGKGTFQDGMACSTANRIGTCIMNEGTSTEVHKRYYAPKTVMEAQGDCSLANQGTGGRFVPN